MSNVISILYPNKDNTTYSVLSDTTIHDLGVDFICEKMTDKESEQKLLLSILSKMTADPDVARFRQDVFSDIRNLPLMREQMADLLNRVRFLKEYSSLKSNSSQKAGIFDLMHRLDALKDYIACVEGIMTCLNNSEIRSTGLLNLRDYITKIYDNAHFKKMKKDIVKLKADTSCIKSVTLGLNLNERYEVMNVGIVSVNNSYFRSSGIVSEFADAISLKDDLKNGTHWNGELRYHALERNTLVTIPDQDNNADATHFLDKTMGQLLNLTSKRLRNTLGQYATFSIADITSLIPEFKYYILFAETIEKLCKNGMLFHQAEVMTGENSLMKARGFYNLKLAFASEQTEIIKNDLDFDMQHLIYILTGANRGGKTTVTQAIGLLYVLAQGGIYVPCESFSYVPVDCIFTHFPADEEKTMDLGRLGEECRRFKELFSSATENSLMLLNETFSTTSFEEGYYIAYDAVKALLRKKARTIYNTHMHKLAYEIDNLNIAIRNGTSSPQAASLIVESEGGNRSFIISVAPPIGLSFAKDIAKKYGVTYEMLTK